MRSTTVALLGALGAGVLALLNVLSGPVPATQHHKVIEINPSDAGTSCRDDFVEAARNLRPGDELVLRGGIYSQNCRRRIVDLHGTASLPIVIRAAEGEMPILTRPSSPTHEYLHNNLEIQNSSFLVIRGLQLRGGSSGLKFIGFNQNITLDGNEIWDTGNNAIAMNDGYTEGFVIRRNHIHDTGLLSLSVGTTEGEGMYVGCNYAHCIAANHLIEGNYIHHLRGTSEGGNDGIEIKPGSYGITVRDNVIHDTTIGTRFPCVFAYGGGIRSNLVEGNALWRCGEGVQAVSDVVVRNNIIASSDIGISSGPHVQVSGMKDLTIVNNTLYAHRECIRIRWETATNTVLANNALFCPGATAVAGSGLRGAGKIVTANVIEGAVTGVLKDPSQFSPGGTAGVTFVNAQTLDLWPRVPSLLVGAAAGGLSPERDFNGTLRRAPYDVGAYQTNGERSNPGWRPRAEMKSVPSSGN